MMGGDSDKNNVNERMSQLRTRVERITALTVTVTTITLVAITLLLIEIYRRDQRVRYWINKVEQLPEEDREDILRYIE